jgi:hypothetical protein
MDSSSCIRGVRVEFSGEHLTSIVKALGSNPSSTKNYFREILSRKEMVIFY